jgi:hypothetical protein
MFPFPWPLNCADHGLSADQRAHRERISAAAAALEAQRSRWLNPPELLIEAEPLAPILPPRLVPKDEAAAKELRKRTLPNLYNARPAWLTNLHQTLDEAVLGGYGWPADLSDEDLLRRLLVLNHDRARS